MSSFNIGLDLAGAAISGAGVPAPYPPPPGYRREYVTESGVAVIERGQPVVELVRID
jgi:hypothetical protein